MTSYLYDSHLRPYQIRFPTNGETLTYTYNSLGLVKILHSSLSGNLVANAAYRNRGPGMDAPGTGGWP